jgi:hypothetical protein
LYDGGKVELVAGTGETAQTQSLEAVMGLQVRKAHLEALSFVTRPGEGLRIGLPAQPADPLGVKNSRSLGSR